MVLTAVLNIVLCIHKSVNSQYVQIGVLIRFEYIGIQGYVFLNSAQPFTCLLLFLTFFYYFIFVQQNQQKNIDAM